MESRRIDLGSAHWLDLTNASPEELRAICQKYQVPDFLAEDCLDPSALPKLQRLDGGMFLMLRCFDAASRPHAASAQDLTRKLAVVWGEGFLLTIHRSAMPWLDQVWSAFQRKPTSLPEAVFHIIEDCIYTYEHPIDLDAEAIARLEEKIFLERSTRATSGETLETAYLVKKRAFTLKRLLRLTRDLLPGISKLGDSSTSRVQELKEEADRLYFYSDDLAESANDLVQLSISMSSNRMNELVRMLTIVSIFLLPLNLITGIYGMNFEFMPEVKHQWGYPIALLSMAAIVIATYFVLRRRGWIRRQD